MEADLAGYPENQPQEDSPKTGDLVGKGAENSPKMEELEAQLKEMVNEIEKLKIEVYRLQGVASSIPVLQSAIQALQNVFNGNTRG